MGPAVVAFLERIGEQNFRGARDRQQRCQGYIIERAPVNDILDDRVLAVQAVVLGAGATTPLRIVLDDAVASLPARVMRRRCDEVPQSLPWRGEIPLYQHIGVRALNKVARRLGFSRPRLLEVAYPALRFADMLDRLRVLLKALRRGVDPHRSQAGVGESA